MYQMEPRSLRKRVLGALLAPISIAGVILASSPEAKAAPPTSSSVFYSIKVPTGANPFQLVTYTSNGSAPSATFSANSSISCTVCGTASRVNAISYDRSGKHVYFFDTGTGTNAILNYANISSGSPVWGSVGAVTTPGTTLSATLFTSGAAFFGDSMYVSLNNSNSIYKYQIAYTGPGGTPVIASTTRFILPSLSATTTFGDIAFDASGRLYGYTAGANPTFFSVKLSDIAGSYQSSTVTGGPSLQIAFGSDGLLYGAGSTDGNFYRVSTADGSATNLGAISYSGGPNSTITDFASAQPDPVPGPLPMLGAAVAFRFSRKLRGRIKPGPKLTVVS